MYPDAPAPKFAKKELFLIKATQYVTGKTFVCVVNAEDSLSAACKFLDTFAGTRDLECIEITRLTILEA